MKIDRAGYPFIAAALVPAAALALARRPVLAASFAAARRLPHVSSSATPTARSRPSRDLVVSPADGKVMIAGPSDGRWAPPGQWKQITIFLSPMDVHINRTPVGGRVTRVDYRPGKFLPAYNEGSNDNELNEIWIDHAGRTVVFRQVVGILARRVVCRVREGDVLERGQRIGLMKFGSRMDVFLPMDADLRVAVGQRVVGGETVLATLRAADAR